MRDYEAKFWLPFKGVHKPVYAIPGNHDWYDALEAFNVTFLRPTQRAPA
jgi:DNA repair exonuclease SbcCD nuclease subunit